MRRTLLILTGGLLQLASLAQTNNSLYWQATLHKNGAVQLTRKGTGQIMRIEPAFTLFYRPDSPTLTLPRSKHLVYQIPNWTRTDGRGRTFDIYRAATTTSFGLPKATVHPNRIDWTFAPTEKGRLQASLLLTDSIPLVTYQFITAQSGYMAVGFAPFAEVPYRQVESLWQPLIWQERRMPDSCYVSAELMCSTPTVFVQSGGISRGVAVHPQESPFRMPTLPNSRFGVMLRNPRGNAQPATMAPLFGQQDSYRKVGDTLTFSTYIMAVPGRADQAFQQAARQVYRFKDYRRNGTGSLNETIENMIAYAMNDRYSHWIADLKGSDYTTDVKGTVKNVSALHPLSVAFVTDNEDIFKRRALPMTEYLLSREKYLFSLSEGITHQSPSHFMRGPAIEVSELAALYAFSNKNSPVFQQYAVNLVGKTRRLNVELPSEAESWPSLLALYRSTGRASYLGKARQKALDYIQNRINTPQADFSDAHLLPTTGAAFGGMFWSDFAPKWVDLLELYETTREVRFLEAAHQGARYYAMYVWLHPVVPAGNTVVHPGDSLKMYYINRNLSPNPIPYSVKRQEVPAWRVSNVGLTPEAANTYQGNPAIFLTHYAAYMLRLAQYTNDDLLRDIARSAVVGRYANYPGYDINYEFTTVYQRADYPLHDDNQFTFNQLYFNHVWPHIALLVDYLVADVETKSGGMIKFPSQYAQGYAYLQSKVYGAEPGEFYGDKAVSLWLPANTLTTNNSQMNYLTGYGNDKFYVALSNQSPDQETVTIDLNPDVVYFDAQRTYRVKIIGKNGSSQMQPMRNGKLTLTLEGHGLTSLIVEDLTVKTSFQHKLKAMPELAGGAASQQSQLLTATTPQGNVTGMMLSWGHNLHNAYVWLSATEKDLKEARLHYTLDGITWKTITDSGYPFEFSIPLSNAERKRGFSYRVEGITLDNGGSNTTVLLLK